jgi:hypothetical protein
MLKYYFACCRQPRLFPMNASLRGLWMLPERSTFRDSRRNSVAPRLLPRCSFLFKSFLNPLQSALPKNAPVSLAGSALAKYTDLKPSRIRIYQKRGEGGVLRLTTSSRKISRPLDKRLHLYTIVEFAFSLSFPSTLNVQLSNCLPPLPARPLL